MDRRSFLRSSGIGAAGALGLGAGTAGAQEPINLYRAKGTPAAALDRVVKAMGGIGRFVKPGDRVVLKPNMSFSLPASAGCTTHPALVATMARMCVDAGARKIVVLDHTLRPADACRERTGIGAACDGIPRTVIHLPDHRRYYAPAPVPGGTELKTMETAKVLRKTDVVINMPTAKSHSATGVSLGMKNWMGVIWDRAYFHRQADCNRAIADLACAMRPALVVMDAVHALTAGGPGGPGTVTALDTVIAGTDQVAVDSYTTGLSEWDGKRLTGRDVPHIRYAAERGLGEIDERNMYVRTV